MNMRSRARGEEGAAAVEFALIVGVLAMLIFGMLQFGVAFFELQNLRAATREGSRVGAVKGTVGQIQTQVDQLTGIQSPSDWGTSLRIQTITSGGSPITVSGTGTKPCAPLSGPTPDTVRTAIFLDDNSLPSRFKDAFTVEIPLLPPISMRSALVYGDFRCEN